MMRANERVRVRVEQRRALDAIFKALSDPIRRRILTELRQECLSASQLSDLVPVEGSSLTYHLRILKNSRLVKANRSGRSISYSLSETALDDVFSRGQHRPEDSGLLDHAPAVADYPPAIAPMIKNGSVPDAMASGKGADGESCVTSSLQAKETHEWAPLPRRMIADRPSQHRIPCLERVQDRRPRHRSVDREHYFGVDPGQRSQMVR